MSDLPNPTPGAPQSTPQAGVPSPIPASQSGAVSSVQGADPNVVEQVEMIVAQTPNNPFERANQIHALKSSYLQTHHDLGSEDVA